MLATALQTALYFFSFLHGLICGPCFSPQIVTQTVEMYKCHNITADFHVKVSVHRARVLLSTPVCCALGSWLPECEFFHNPYRSQVGTLQLDMSKKLNLTYSKQALFGYVCRPLFFFFGFSLPSPLHRFPPLFIFFIPFLPASPYQQRHLGRSMGY